VKKATATGQTMSNKAKPSVLMPAKAVEKPSGKAANAEPPAAAATEKTAKRAKKRFFMIKTPKVKDAQLTDGNRT
jgi:hypothetical protein